VSARALLFDVEGTTTSLAFVKDELYPYAWRVLPVFLRRHAPRPEVAIILGRLAQELRTDDVDSISQALRTWIDEDRKDPDLKELEGIIWQDGYHTGAFRGHLYDDVLPFWKAAKDRGLVLAVYSSGSVQAQRLLLQHSNYGDVAPLIDHHFDTGVGPKTHVASYERIAIEMALEPGEIRFFSDSVTELDAASAAGFQTCRTLRPGVPPADHGHAEIRDFAEVEALLRE
jgi:enolase-phosphatase E1